MNNSNNEPQIPSSYRLIVGKFGLAQELISQDIEPLEIQRNPLNPAKRLWIFPGNHRTAIIAKNFYDGQELPYSNSLSKLLDILDREAKNDE